MKKFLLPFLTLVLGFVAGFSFMSNEALVRQAIAEEDTNKLVKLSYIRGCTDKGGKLDECKEGQGLKDIFEIFKKTEEILEEPKQVLLNQASPESKGSLVKLNAEQLEAESEVTGTVIKISPQELKLLNESANKT